MTIKEIEALKPRFEFGSGGMEMVEWFKVTKGKSFCCISSGLCHVDGVTKSPYHYDKCIVGKNSLKESILEFEKWWKTININ